MSAASIDSPGEILRAWRTRRGRSQLDLALEADVSTRHLSFLENGRANPSREMIVHLCDVLEVPLRERNRLLESAGYARLYRETRVDDPSAQHVGHIIDLLLECHDPAGAVALDWGWNVVKANRPMLITAAFFSEPELLAEAPLNVMRLMFEPKGMHRFVVNWEEVGSAMVARIRREAEYEGRPESGELLDRLLGSPSVAKSWSRAGSDRPAPALIPLHLRRGDVDLELFSTITTLGTPQDVTLQELRIESFHPMNPRSAAALRKLVEFAGL